MVNYATGWRVETVVRVMDFVNNDETNAALNMLQVGSVHCHEVWIYVDNQSVHNVLLILDFILVFFIETEESRVLQCTGHGT